MTLCVIDWSLRIGFLQFFAIAVTGSGAIIVAIAQINPFINAERSKATLDSMARFDAVLHRISATKVMSPSWALSLGSGLLTPRDLAHYKAVASANGLSVLSLLDKKDYDRYTESITVASNYFVLAAGLVRYKRLDRKLLVSFFFRQILFIRDTLIAVKDVQSLVAKTLNDPISSD